MSIYSESSARFYAVGLIIAVFLIFASMSSAFGQERSTDRDNPTPLTANVVTDELDGTDTAYFYKFTAGPGKLTVTIEVKASGTNAGAMFDLFDANSRPILTDVLAQGIDGGSERIVNSVQLSGKRDIVMKVKGLKYGDTGGTGTYKITLNGPVMVPAAPAPAPAPAAPAPAPAAPAPAPAAPAPAPGPVPIANNAPAAGNGAAGAPAATSLWSGQLDPTDERVLFRHVNVSGPGQVTFSFNVKATDAQAAATFALITEKGTQPLDRIELQGGEGISKPVTFDKAQKLLMMVAVNKGAGKVGRGSYTVQLTGPASFAGAPPNESNPITGQLDPAVTIPTFHVVNVNSPGQGSITFSVKATDAKATAKIYVGPMNGGPQIVPALEVQGGETVTKPVTYDKPQTIVVMILSTKFPDNTGRGTYAIQLSGPITVIR